MRAATGVLLQALGLFLVLGGLYLARLRSYLLFHSLVEIFTVIVACAIFLLAWNARRYLENQYLLFVGIAYAFTGMVDLTHTLAYRGMGVFPGAGADLATQLWLLGRLVQGVSLLAAPAFIRRPVPVGGVVAGYAGLVGLGLLAIHQGILPPAFVEGEGLTPFKQWSEIVVVGLLAAAAILLLRARRAFDPAVLRLMVASIAATALSELPFLLYTDPYAHWNLLGHSIRLVAYYLAYKALVETGLRRPYDLLFRELKASEAALREARDALERRVKERTAELEQVNLALRGLSARSMRMREAEARRIARELHDEVGQSLTSLLLQLKAVESAGELETMRSRAEGLRPLVAKTLTEVRNLIRDIRPGSLDELGLAVALERYAQGFTAATGIAVDVCTAGFAGATLAPEAETALFRIGQEALTNAARHAQARVLSVTLSRRGPSAILVVEDDGHGFDVAAARGAGREQGGLGLLGMEERAALLGGRLTVESRPGGGTTVVAEIPLGPTGGEDDGHSRAGG
ncbi:MAG: MASE3 domain-containing protein [Candidatus Methylomirabilota bacterium]